MWKLKSSLFNQVNFNNNKYEFEFCRRIPKNWADKLNPGQEFQNDWDMVEPTESSLIDLDETPSINLKKSGFISALEIIKELCQTS